MAKNLREIIEERSLFCEADTLTMSVPLFIRMLEYAKEDAKTDMDLHKATERALAMKGALDMDQYDAIIGEETIDEAWGIPERKTPGTDTFEKSGSRYGIHAQYKNKDTVLVTPKGYKGGGKVTRILKSKYDPKKHSLAEAAKWKKKVSKGPTKPDIKTQADIHKEKSARRKTAKAAIKSDKKVTFQKFGRWDSKRKSAREKLED